MPPGGWVVLAVTLDHKGRSGTPTPTTPDCRRSGFGDAGTVAIPTTIEVTGPAGATVGQIEWPAAHAILLKPDRLGHAEP